MRAGHLENVMGMSLSAKLDVAVASGMCVDLILRGSVRPSFIKSNNRLRITAWSWAVQLSSPHRTGRADFPHPALQSSSSGGVRRSPSRYMLGSPRREQF
jgi:hypothetical protein